MFSWDTDSNTFTMLWLWGCLQICSFALIYDLKQMYKCIAGLWNVSFQCLIYIMINGEKQNKKAEDKKLIHSFVSPYLKASIYFYFITSSFETWQPFTNFLFHVKLIPKKKYKGKKTKNKKHLLSRCFSLCFFS